MEDKCMIAVCDDNALEGAEVIKCIEKHFPRACQVDYYQSGDELIQVMVEDNQHYGMVFMDIQLENESGIEVVRQLHSHSPYTQYVFVTNYMEYASDVYEVDHLYFVYKSKMEEYMEKVIVKAAEKVKELEDSYLNVTFRKEWYQIPIKNIQYMERNLRITEIHTEKDIYYTSERLNDLLERLPEWFAISNRSYIVNFHYIKKMTRNMIEMYDGTEISMGNTHRDQFRKQYMDYVMK